MNNTMEITLKWYVYIDLSKSVSPIFSVIILRIDLQWMQTYVDDFWVYQ